MKFTLKNQFFAVVIFVRYSNFNNRNYVQHYVFAFIMALVYLVESDGHMKVGMTKDLPQRMATLQTARHAPLVLLDAFPFETRDAAREAEAAAHTFLKNEGWHAHLEWFKPPDEVTMARLKQCLSREMPWPLTEAQEASVRLEAVWGRWRRPSKGTDT